MSSDRLEPFSPLEQKVAGKMAARGKEEEEGDSGEDEAQ